MTNIQIKGDDWQLELVVNSPDEAAEVLKRWLEELDALKEESDEGSNI